MLDIFLIIAPLFLIVFVVALLQRFTHIGDDWGVVLNEFALKIGLPVLIFSAFANISFSFVSEIQTIIANILFILINFGLALILGGLFRLKKQMFSTLFICFVFHNAIYLGLPLLKQVFGGQIVPTATIIGTVYLFLTFTFGIGYLEYLSDKTTKNLIKNVTKNLLCNPLLWSIFLGLLVSSFHIPIPSILGKSLDIVSASVTPIILVAIGLFIGKSRLGDLSEWYPAILFSFFLLVISPSLFYLGAFLLGFPISLFSLSIIQAAMPLAITPFALADKYNLDKDFIVRSIVLSTLFSVISLPFWIYITS